MKVKDLMSTEALQSCSFETKLRNVAKVMKDNKHGSLTILDNEKKLFGWLLIETYVYP